jgi:hypothetical protein
VKKIVSLIALILFFAASPVFADMSAKAGLAQAKQVASKWQPDAAITRVGTPGANAGGTSRLWQYDVYSQKSRKCARIQIVTDTPPQLREFHSCIAIKPISDDFVDSPVAIGEAKKNGFKPGDIVTMILNYSKDRKLKPARECWTVSSHNDFDPSTALTRGWCVDPKTGKFVMRLMGGR